MSHGVGHTSTRRKISSYICVPRMSHVYLSAITTICDLINRRKGLSLVVQALQHNPSTEHNVSNLRLNRNELSNTSMQCKFNLHICTEFKMSTEKLTLLHGYMCSLLGNASRVQVQQNLIYCIALKTETLF